MRRRAVLLAGTMIATLATATGGVATATDAETAATSERHLVVLDGAVDAADGIVAQVLGDAAAQVVGPTLGRWTTPLLRRALVGATFDSALDGFVVEGASASLLEALRAHPAVALVEADRPIGVQALPTGVDRVEADRNGDVALGSGRDADVDVAVIDTGVATGLADLRVVSTQDCRDGCRPGGPDADGHGTHVAGILAARDDGVGPVGVAPGARIWSLKVLDGLDVAGSALDLVAALDFVTRHADQIEVANVSLGGPGRSAALDHAVAGAVEAGVTVVVAAGNDGGDAARQTPANSPGALTVSAFVDTDGAPGGRGEDSCGRDDTVASWSNHGSIVDLAAPGGCIVSLTPGGATQQLSGTSMATPHVAGAAAQYIASRDLSVSAERPARVRHGLRTEWAVPQDGPCGFRGGRSAEPVLQLAPCGTAAPSPSPRPAPPPPPTPTPSPQPPAAAPRPPRPEAGVATVVFRDGRALLGGRWLTTTLTVASGQDRVDGAEVTWQLRGADGTVHDSFTHTTGRDGTVRAQARGLDPGCYRVVVVQVRVPASAFDGHTPPNEHCI